MPQFTINLSDELNICKEQRAEDKEEPFLESNYSLINSYKKKMELGMEALRIQTKIPLQDIQLSPSYYAITNPHFFIEHFKNAYDAEANQFQITVNLDEERKELICTIKDNGKGFSSMFVVPREPVKPPPTVISDEAPPSTEKQEYLAAKAKYDRQIQRVRGKDPLGFLDYRKIIDPAFDPAVGLTQGRVVSDKGANGPGYETKEGIIVTGGRGLGLSSVTTLVNNTTRMRGSIKIGDTTSLASNPELQAVLGAPIEGALTGAVTVFSSPIFSPEVHQATTEYLKSNPIRSAQNEKDYLRFVDARIKPIVDEEVEEFAEFSFGSGGSTPRATGASGAGFTAPESVPSETLLPTSPRSPIATGTGISTPESAQAEILLNPNSPRSPTPGTSASAEDELAFRDSPTPPHPAVVATEDKSPVAPKTETLLSPSSPKSPSRRLLFFGEKERTSPEESPDLEPHVSPSSPKV